MADKTKSIKSSSDKELDELLVRLRKENEAQDLIRNIKIKALPTNQNGGCPDYSLYEGVSTEAPIEDLYHFGIPGMKWGVRRSEASLHSGRKSNKKDVSDDYKTSRTLKAKGAKHLSNKELKDLTTRMQLERNLRDLKSSDYQKGLDFVKTATAIGTTLATAYALTQTPLFKDVTKVVKKGS